MVRYNAEHFFWLVLGTPSPPAGARERVGQYLEQSPLVQTARACFPAPLRRHTLLLLLSESPYFVDELEPALRESYRSALGAGS